MLTKQDLQKIAEYIKRLSVRDTEFPDLNSVDDTTRIPVVQNSLNRLTYMAAILAYVVGNMDLASMPINLNDPDITSRTLAGILSDLKVLITTPRDPENNPITAYDIVYKPDPETGDNTTIGTGLDTLENAITTLQATLGDYTGLTDEQEELLNKLALLLLTITENSIDFSKLNSTNITNLETAAGNFTNNTPGYQTADDVRSIIEDNEWGYQTEQQVLDAITAKLEAFLQEGLHIKDTLDSEDTDWALSANQGRILKQAIMDLTNALANLAFIGERPYTGQQNWNITEGFNVTIYNESKSELALVINNTVVASESFTVKYPQGSSNTIKVYVRPVNNTRFLDSVSYSVGEYNPYQRVTITEDNKREVLITLTGIDSDTIVKIKGTTRSAIQYNVTYPDDSYLSFPDNAPNVVLEGSTFSTVATVSDNVPNTITYRSIDVKMGNSTKTFTFSTSTPKTCSIELTDVNGAISMDINKINSGTTYQVYGLTAGNGYTWQGELTAYEGQDYSIVISPTTGYILVSITVVHGTSTMPYGAIQQSGANTITVHDVSADIQISVLTQQVTVVDKVTVSAGNLVDLVLMPPEAEMDKGGTYYGKLSLAPDATNKRLPDEITIAPQAEQGTGLLSAPNMSTEIGGLDPYDEPASNNSMFTSFSYDKTTGNITIQGVKQDLTINAQAISDVNTVKVTFKTLNIDCVEIDSESVSGLNRNMFGYEYTYISANDMHTIVLSGKNGATLHNDLRVRKDNELIYYSGILSSPITYSSGNGTIFVNPEAVTGATELVIETTASIGVVTAVSSTQNATMTFTLPDDSTVTLTCEDSDDGVNYVGTAEITVFKDVTFSDKNAFLSLDFGGAICVNDSLATGGMFSDLDNLISVFGLVNHLNYRYQLFYGCNLLEVIDVIGWETTGTNLTNRQLFQGCNSLKRIDVTGLVTSNHTNIYNMFANCKALTTIKGLNTWNTSSITSWGGLFSAVPLIDAALGETEVLDISNWTGTPTDITNTFSKCNYSTVIFGDVDFSAVNSNASIFLPSTVKTLKFTTSDVPGMSTTDNYNMLKHCYGIWGRTSNALLTDGKILVPAAAVDDYKDEWPDFATIIEGY